MIEGLPWLGMTVVDVIKDLYLEALEDFQPTSLLAYKVQGAEGEGNPNVPAKCKEVVSTSTFLKTCKNKPFPESTLQNVLVRAVLDVALAQLQAIGSILPIIIIFVKNVIHLRLRKLPHEISLSLSSVTNGRSSVSGSFSLFF